MKITTLLTLAFLCPVVAALEIPRTVHRSTGIAKASEEAAASKRGIVWVLSDATLKPS